MLNYRPEYTCLLLIPLFSCTSGKYTDIPTYSVSCKDFENAITIDGFIEPVQTVTTTCPMDVDGVIIYLVEDGTFVKAGDTLCIIEFNELQRDYDERLIDMENTKADFNKTKANLDLQYTLLEAQVENNNANTKIAQLDSLQLVYAPPNIRKIKELELEKAAIQKRQIDKKLQSLDIINQSEIRRWELRIQRITNRIQSLKKRLDELVITAPKDGLAIIDRHRITDKKNQIGDPVWNNMPLVSIPELSEMKTKISATETEYKYINLDDSVVYTFDAMPGNKAWGKIKKKSPIGTPYKRDSKMKIFDIEASIDSVLSMPSPGFKANCRVILKEIKDVLAVPQVCVFDEDSIKAVYVQNKKGFEMRQISTGLSSSKEVIITEGLKENEKIALTKPVSSMINKKILLEIKKEEGDKEDKEDKGDKINEN